MDSRKSPKQYADFGGLLMDLGSHANFTFLILPPRAYPAGFGDNLRKAWEAHLATCERRELRFKPQVSTFNGSTPVEQFNQLPLNDLWEDAKLWEPLAYLFKSKKLRLGMNFVGMVQIAVIRSLNSGSNRLL